MPKEIPDCPKKPSPTPEAARSYEIELITPMFEGGVEPRVNDSTFPIRPTAIRGQLQFWWRASIGAKYATLADLRAAQSAIWGSTERASRVQVLVENVQASNSSPCASIDWDQRARRGQGGWRINWQAPFNGQDSALPYVLFPFQGETPPPNRNATVTVPPAACIRNAKFRLTLRCPNNLWTQVEPAVWAWANFGGMGGRTRRGCGAILCNELAPRDHAHLTEELKRFAPQQSDIREWPTVPTGILACERPGASIEVWAWLIGLFKHFRQGPGFARNQGQQPNRPGRSRYPEPETIRETLGADRQRSGHQRLPEIPADAFPRAEFGLPIIYELRGDGEPPKTSLQPIVDGKPGDRMASPLILKPLALANGQALPVIVRLVAPQINDVVLMQGKHEQRRFDGTAIRGPRLATTGDQPMSHSTNGSALEAFLAFARTEGFTEVPQ